MIMCVQLEGGELNVRMSRTSTPGGGAGGTETTGRSGPNTRGRQMGGQNGQSKMRHLNFIMEFDVTEIELMWKSFIRTIHLFIRGAILFT